MNVSLIPIWGNELFIFPRSDIKTKRDVEVHNSTHHASRIMKKVGNGNALIGTKCFNTTQFPSAYPAIRAGYSVKTCEIYL